MKKTLFVILLAFVLVLSSCTTSTTDDMSKDPVDGKEQENMDEKTEENMLMLTLEQLSMYDGKDGNDAYIAVDGVLYDVTGVDAWTNGTHNGNMAGTDVSSVIDNAPHGDSVLEDLEVIGELVE